MCTDVLLLNAKTVNSLPRQTDWWTALGGNAVFSIEAVKSRFYNVPLHESDKWYMTFTMPLRLYEYNRPPGILYADDDIECLCWIEL